MMSESDGRRRLIFVCPWLIVPGLEDADHTGMGAKECGCSVKLLEVICDMGGPRCSCSSEWGNVGASTNRWIGREVNRRVLVNDQELRQTEF